MSSVLAVVSKAIFEKQAPKGLAVGQTWPTASYVSKNPGLTPLAAGGALFLVTVRPPDERLWLVAVLESPKLEGEAWTAKASVVPVADVTALLPELRFASGKGVSAEPGKLGMSLQTPRELTEADVALLRGSKTSSPAASAPSSPSPSPAAPPSLSPSPAAPPSPKTTPSTKTTTSTPGSRPTPTAPPPFEDPLREGLVWLAEHGTVAHFQANKALLDQATGWDTFRASPSLHELVRSIDPVKLLQRQLAGGLLDELRWPAQEEVAKRLGDDAEVVHCGPFPYVGFVSKGRDRVIVAGPDGIVHDTPLKLPAKSHIDAAMWIEEQLLVVYRVGSKYVAKWLSGGKLLEFSDFTSSRIAAPGFGAITGDELGPITPEKPTQKSFGGSVRLLFAEGGRYFRAGSHYARGEIDAKGRAGTSDQIEELDPRTGKALGVGLPPWFAARMKEPKARLRTDASFLYPVPARAERSPLGAKDGLGALIVRREADGSIYAEGADGRSWRTTIATPPKDDEEEDKRGLPCALLRMPERDGIHPVVEGDRVLDVLCPDGRTVLAWLGHRNSWAGRPQELFDHAHGLVGWLHLYEPRDAKASRALRDTSHETAERLLAAAAKTYDGNPDPAAWQAVGGLCAPLRAWPALAAAARPLFPDADDHLLSGILTVAMDAAAAQFALSTFMVQLDDLRARLSEPEETTPWSDGDTAEWDVLFPGIRFGHASQREGQDLRRSLRSIERFLFDERPPRADVMNGAKSLAWWEPLFMHQGGLVFRMFAEGTPLLVRKQLRALLGMWSTTDLANRCEELRYLGVQQLKGKLPDTDHTKPTLVAAKNRYVYRFVHVTSGGGSLDEYAYYVTERAMNGEFIDPEGAKILFDERPARFWHGKERLQAALRLFDEGLAEGSKAPRTMPYGPAIIARIAEGTGLTPTAVAIVWTNALRKTTWKTLVLDEMQQKLGIKKKKDLERAMEELSHADLRQVYAHATPEDPADLFDADVAVESFIKAWRKVHGKQPPLPVERVAQIEAELRGAPIRAVDAVRALADVAHEENFSKDARWVIRPYQGFQSHLSWMQGYVPPGWPKPESMGEEESTSTAAVFDGRVLRYYLRYVPWAYQDLAVGDPMREGAAQIALLARERLKNPELLLLAGAIDLSRETDSMKQSAAWKELVSRFSGAPYRAVDGKAGAPGIDRGDLVVTWPKGDEAESGVFFAFRPAQVTNAEALEKLTRELGVEALFQKKRRGCACGLNFGSYGSVTNSDLGPWLAFLAPGFQAMIDDLAAPKLATGRYASDPRAVRPDLVEAARKKHDLPEDAATLLLQTLTLPDPTPKRVMRVNGWTRPAYDAAKKLLLAKKLAVESEQPRTTRTLFLPGPILMPPSPAAPIESSKAALYDVDAAMPPVFGVILPTSPLGDLFEEAWKA
jgi:hypothetical protein